MDAREAAPSTLGRVAVDTVLAQSVTRGERTIALLRLALVGLAMARTVMVWHRLGWAADASSVWLPMAAFSTAVGFSVFSLVRLRRKRASPPMLVMSVTVDVLTCVAALASNPLSPGPGYRGLLFMPDLGTLVLIAVTAGLRLSPRIALFGGVILLAGLAALVQLDIATGQRFDDQALRHLTGFVLLLIAGNGIGTITALRTRALAEAGARRVVQLDRIGRNLRRVLRDHHDVRTLLAAGIIHAELLERTLSAGHDAARLQQPVGAVRADLGAIKAIVGSIRENAQRAGGSVAEAQPERRRLGLSGLALNRLLAEAASEGERFVAWGRLVIGMSAVARSAWVWWAVGWALTPAPARVSVAVFAAVVGFSLFVLMRPNQETASLGLHVGSVAVDIGAASVALFATLLWTEPDYRGLIFMPELGALLLPVFASCLRISLLAALFGGGFALLALAALLAVDLEVAGSLGPVGFEYVSAHVASLVGATGIAAFTAVRARYLVRAAAEHALATDAAEREMTGLMQRRAEVDEHLRAAREHSGRVTRHLSKQPHGEAAELASQVAADIEALREFLATAVVEAEQEIESWESPHPTPVAEVADAVLRGLRSRFPDVRLTISQTCSEPAMVAGGRAGLESVLVNLVVNACEGDGTRVACAVDLFVRAEAEGIALEVRDDGPGFRAEALRDQRLDPPTNKPDGSGLGLGMVRAVVEASGGSMQRANGSEGGGIVTALFPFPASESHSTRDLRGARGS